MKHHLVKAYYSLLESPKAQNTTRTQSDTVSYKEKAAGDWILDMSNKNRNFPDGFGNMFFMNKLSANLVTTDLYTTSSIGQ